MLRRSRVFAWTMGMQLIFGVACMGRLPGCGTTPEEVERENVAALMSAQDTLVTDAGGTVVGALFEDEHRYPIAWAELPEAWIVAIVASEDGRFWRHGGVDATHVARAARDNLTAGGVVAGGSTLTQQTAKNLFERQDRSLGAKFQELDQALHLEEVFAKHEILEMYANLFHVTGNGEGLGIAARYFFDDEAEDLTLHESAFLAGIVKGPANYDPFRGTAEERDEAQRRARERTRYVLSRIVEEDVDNLVPTSGDRVSAERVRALKTEAQRLLDDDPALPFARGRFRFDRTVVLDEVEAALDGDDFRDVLTRADVEDWRTAGLTIETSLDAAIQREAVYALRHHLTEIGLWLEESDVTRLVLDAAPPAYAPELVPPRHGLSRAVVTEAVEGVVVDLGGRLCAIDADAIRRVADALHRGAEGDRGANAPKELVTAVRGALVPGTVVEVSIRERPAKGPAVCDLELVPELQGAVVVLEDGEVRAMVGGSENRDFNRVMAKRQFGSTFKPLVYHAALTLGWLPTDRLENERQTFRFSTTDYSPSPDHRPAPQVSMAWAGVKSENIASVWLLAHLVDRLSPEQLESLAADLELGPAPDETAEAYGRRLKGLGVDLGRSDPVNLRLQEQTAALAEELRLAGNEPEARAVLALEDAGQQALFRQADTCLDAFERFARAPKRDPVWPKNLYALRSGASVQLACETSPPGFRRVRAVFGDDGRRSGPLTRLGRRSQWRGRMILPGGITVDTAKALERIVKSSESSSTPTDLPATDPRRLKANPDFRWLVGLRYVRDLARRYGVTSELPDVMSLPLGSVEISLQEAALMYAGITSGRYGSATARGPEPDDGGAGPLPPPPSPTLITKITKADGTVIFEASPEPDVVTSPAVATMTADILRNVVEHGTGRRARDAVSVGGARVPLGGKTGTTNDFKNAAFVGFVPGTADSGFSASAGHIVAAYVGYDDNRPMERGGIRIAGSSGALPVWIGAAEGAASRAELRAPTGVSPRNGVWPLAPEGLVAEAVETDRGLPSGSGATVLVADERTVDLPGAAPRPVEKPKPRSRKRSRWWQRWRPF